MCRPTPPAAATAAAAPDHGADDAIPHPPPRVCRVLIAGAGPAGLLLHALLDHRNKAIAASSSSSSSSSRVTYRVTIVDGRQDLGLCTKEELMANHRSWMIGLAGHGLEAVRSVPGLWEGYLSEGVGVKLKEFGLIVGSRRMSAGTGSDDDDDIRAKGGGEKNNNNVATNQEAFIVDRNFIVAALARYARENIPSGGGGDGSGGIPDHSFRYGTDLMYVDSDNRRALLRDRNTKIEEYVSYDLLVGSDGVRSVVREALVKRHFDMELHVSDIFQHFKAVHIRRPSSVPHASISLMPGCLPKFTGISLPETNDMINVSLGVPRNHFDDIPSDLRSDDPKIVAAYLKKNFRAFALDDDDEYLDWATQWTNQRWNVTGQVHCNRYHSSECGIVLMGDSAHATSPSIGMGMNTALRDAQKFHELLDEYDDDLGRVLPRYSIDRVPEGNALTALAMNLFCFDTSVQMRTLIRGVLRTGLHSLFPKFVDPDPQAIIGMPEYTLSYAYDMAVGQGIIARHRDINMRTRQEFFERQTGMVTTKAKGNSLGLYAALVAAVLAVGAIQLSQGVW
jgi:kynurenine 3-monooxygenase